MRFVDLAQSGRRMSEFDRFRTDEGVGQSNYAHTFLKAGGPTFVGVCGKICAFAAGSRVMLMPFLETKNVGDPCQRGVLDSLQIRHTT